MLRQAEFCQRSYPHVDHRYDFVYQAHPHGTYVSLPMFWGTSFAQISLPYHQECHSRFPQSPQYDLFALNIWLYGKDFTMLLGSQLSYLSSVLQSDSLVYNSVYILSCFLITFPSRNDTVRVKAISGKIPFKNT